MNERYEIRGLIAKGGGASVHLGWDRRTNREVAIKRAAAKDGESALLNEAGVLRLIRHPNIVSVLDAGEDDEGPFVVMELVIGKTLEDMVADRPLDEVEFEQVATQSLEALVAAHAMNVVHQDLKPQNLMVGKDDAGRLKVKVLDFGVAREATPSGYPAAKNEGPVMGSLFFMAPERFERAPGDERSDLYSLGCVLYYALTRQPPFQGDTAPLVMVAHLRHQFTPLAEMRPDLPAFIVRWVEWLLRRRPEDRPATASIALAAFQERRLEE